LIYYEYGWGSIFVKVVVTAIANKKAETVADAIFKDWFAKFGIPEQIPMAARNS
jgi:hypothetical protein